VSRNLPIKFVGKGETLFCGQGRDERKRSVIKEEKDLIRRRSKERGKKLEEKDSSGGVKKKEENKLPQWKR